jgi:hypothetical protein
MGIEPFKPCEILKTHSEVHLSTYLLSKHNMISNPCDVKNWDLAHILPQLSDGNILDMGCQGSYIIDNALKMGLKGEKIGIDLVPLPSPPGATILQGDITRTQLPSNHFDYMTCLSVIEHGVDLPAFAAESARLLKVGGTLWVTFDYWPQKLGGGIRLFGAPWTIFCQDDVVGFLKMCSDLGLESITPMDWTTMNAVIRPGYHSPGPMSYTFGILQLKKVRDVKPNGTAGDDPSAAATSEKINNVLIVNRDEKACGVYQYGQNLFDILSRNEKRFHYHMVEVSSAQDVLKAAVDLKPCAIIFNYHPATQPFVDRGLIHQLGVPCFGIYHEITHELLQLGGSPFPFDRWIHGDPTMEDRAYLFSTGRPLFTYENRFPQPRIPTIGSFGFGFANKGFGRLAKMVQEQFSEAVLRLHIPFAKFGDEDGTQARQRVAEVRGIITNPRIVVQTSHQMMSTPELLDFLAQNTLNAFLYDDMHRGISSTLDYAMSVGRPIAISRSYMFRHVWDVKPSILVEETTLPEIIRNGTAPLKALKEKWTHAALAERFESIISAQMVGKV